MKKTKKGPAKKMAKKAKAMAKGAKAKKVAANMGY